MHKILPLNKIKSFLTHKVFALNSVPVYIFFIVIAFYELMIFGIDYESWFTKSDPAYISWDFSIYKYIASSLLDGDILYKDLFDNKGPLFFFINVLGYIINPSHGIWFINLITNFVAYIFIYLIARNFASRAISFVVVISAMTATYAFYVVYAVSTENTSLLFISASLWIFIKYIYGRKDCYASKYIAVYIVYGFLNACVFMINARVAIVGFIVFLIWALCGLWPFMRDLVASLYAAKSIAGSIKDGFGEFFKLCLWILLGIAIVVIPIYLYFIFNGAFGYYLNDVFFGAHIQDYDNGFWGMVNEFGSEISYPIALAVVFGFFANKKYRVLFIGSSLAIIIYMASAVMTIIYPQPGGPIHYIVVLMPLSAAIWAYGINILYKEAVSKAQKIIAPALLVIMFSLPIVSTAREFYSVITQDAYENTEGLVFEQAGEYIKAITSKRDKVAIYAGRGQATEILYSSDRKSFSRVFNTQIFRDSKTDYKTAYFEEIYDELPEVVVVETTENGGYDWGFGVHLGEIQTYLYNNPYVQAAEFHTGSYIYYIFVYYESEEEYYSYALNYYSNISLDENNSEEDASEPEDVNSNEDG